MSKHFRLAVATVAAALLCATQAQALPISYSGTLTHDDEVRSFSFGSDGSTPITIETFSYAGGSDASGNVVAAGGFDTVFSLFTAAGALVAYGDDGATRADPVTGAFFDAKLTLTLPAGNYFVSLAQFDNFAIGPNYADGFLEAGHATFTAAFGCGAGQFCDINGFSRNGNFDISITGAVPEPATLALYGLALPLLWARRRRALALNASRPAN